MNKYRIYYWGTGLEQWIQFFSTNDIDSAIKKFQDEKRQNPHRILKATEENELRIHMED